MTIGVFSATSQAASTSSAIEEAVLDRPAARDPPQNGVEQEAVDEVARAVPVGEHLAGPRAERARLPQRDRAAGADRRPAHRQQDGGGGDEDHQGCKAWRASGWSSAQA